jgi:GntR family transcriptional regulator, transcriptional repressor for pyruvate dehydrogenase complex
MGLAQFAPIANLPAYRQVAAAIEGRIAASELKPGDALPSELDLARQFGVHRGTLREAIRELESQGLVGRVAGAKQLRITRPDAVHVSTGVSRALALHSVSFLELWEAMMAIGPTAAMYAAVRRRTGDIAAMRTCAERFVRETKNSDAAVAAEVDFFSAVATASGNQVLIFAQDPINRLLAKSLRHMIDRVPQAKTRIATAQARIVRAVTDHKSDDARRWMEKHIRDFKRGYELAGISLDGKVNALVAR